MLKLVLNVLVTNPRVDDLVKCRDNAAVRSRDIRLASEQVDAADVKMKPDLRGPEGSPLPKGRDCKAARERLSFAEEKVKSTRSGHATLHEGAALPCQSEVPDACRHSQ